MDLAPLSAEVIDTFMKIELPDGWKELQAADEMARGRLDLDGLTIGDFYRAISRSIEEGCARHGERAVFSGDPALQIREDFYWSSRGRPWW